MYGSRDTRQTMEQGTNLQWGCASVALYYVNTACDIVGKNCLLKVNILEVSTYFE